MQKMKYPTITIWDRALHSFVLVLVLVLVLDLEARLNSDLYRRSPSS